MCGRAANYHDKRSDLLEELVTELSVFNFIWGASELVIKIIKPPNVPKSNSIIDAACHYLKNEFEPVHPLLHYSDLVSTLRVFLKGNSYYGNLSDEFRLKTFIGIAGVGLHVVRKIRNKFAHGTLNFPEPKEWSGREPVDAKLINLSSKIVLMTIQMLLLALYKNDSVSIEILKDDDGEPMEIDIHSYLRVLHLDYPWPSSDQLSLSL